MTDLMDRFWKYVTKTNSCWIWSGSRFNDGYGSFWTGKKVVRAHRFLMTTIYGKLPSNLLVCHHCDNPPCVRPDHLFLGTHRDNAQDSIQKGRFNRQHGERIGTSKLKNDDVIMIKKMLSEGKSTGYIAKKFGVHSSTISMISNGSNWKWLIP